MAFAFGFTALNLDTLGLFDELACKLLYDVVGYKLLGYKLLGIDCGFSWLADTGKSVLS